MLLSDINPFIRWANILTFSLFRDFSMVYDCRIIYIVKGNGIIQVNNTAYTLKAGMIFLFQPGTLYKLQPTDKFTAIIADFDYTQDHSDETKIFLPVSPENFDKNKSHEKIIFDEISELNSPVISSNLLSLKQDFEALIDEFNKPELYRNEISSSILKKIIFKIIRHLQTSAPNTEILERILKCIHDSYDKQLSNKDIGKQLNYHPVYLNKIFVQAFGISMHQYLIQYRLKCATNYLLTTNLSINEIAFKTGFYSIDHFSRCMKQQTGHSPMFYRKIH